MNLNGWEFDDLAKEMSDKNLYELQQIYIREHKKYIDECVVLTKVMSVEEARIKQEEICNFHDGCVLNVAMKIAKTLTGIR